MKKFMNYPITLLLAVCLMLGGAGVAAAGLSGELDPAEEEKIPVYWCGNYSTKSAMALSHEADEYYYIIHNPKYPLNATFAEGQIPEDRQVIVKVKKEDAAVLNSILHDYR